MPQPEVKEVATKATQIHNPDGSVSTEQSITVGTDRGYINLPTIIDGKRLTDQEAIKRALLTGKHSEPYKTIEEAEKSAQERSDAIGRLLAKER